METEVAALIDVITNRIDEGIKSSSLKPEEEMFFKWEFKGFKYGRKGIESSSAEGKEFTKRVWLSASIKIKDDVEETPEYQNAIKLLQGQFPQRDNLERDLKTILGRIIWRYFDHKENGSAFEPDELTKRIADDLGNKPARYGAEIQFQGIVLESTMIEIPEVGLILRQPTKQDLEKEVHYPGHFLSGVNPLVNPSAIGEISISGYGANEIQLMVEKVTALLRLFMVGSVKPISYSMQTDSLLDILAGGTAISGGNLVAMESSFIETKTEDKLRVFFHQLDPLLPSKFYRFGEGEVSPLTIAFDRYSDSLLRNGIPEERIANVVMGLEALLLDENQELSYRLGLRVARTLSFLGDEAKRVREIVKDSYKIRSIFAHGSQLSPKEKRKSETQYHSLNDLSRTVLDYLRKLIITIILCQKSKDEFVSLVDDSFIDKDAETQLSNVLSGFKNVL